MPNPPLSLRRAAVAAAALAGAVAAPAAHAITDRAGDILSTFAGSVASTDLDVISTTATYNTGNDTFVVTGTMNGPIGLTPTGFYVWGVNRGAGTAGFAANGLPNVLFDATVILRPNGVSTAGGVTLGAGAVTFAGNTISATFSGSLLPTTGFAKTDYTWNLWPRDSQFAGFAAISDFAPDTTNFATLAVPEPETYALLLGGLGLIGWRLRPTSRSTRC